MDQLTTIVFSHYNDRARWALERCGVPHVEHKYLPFFHFGPVWNIGRRYGFGAADPVSTRLSTPVLVTANGTVYHDSSDIVRYAAGRCARADRRIDMDNPEAATLATRFLERLGGHSRRLAYHLLLEAPSLMRAVARENVGTVQSRAFNVLFPAIRVVLRKALDIDEESAARSLATCRDELAFVSDRIGDKSYLVGDQFSDADLAFATMAAPLVIPSRAEGYGATLPRISDLPRGYAQLVREFRATRAGQLAMRLYATERQP